MFDDTKEKLTQEEREVRSEIKLINLINIDI